MNQKHTDILIIGMGLAGITAAITAAQSGKKVTIITKTKEFSSGNTPWAQGGIVYKGLSIIYKSALLSNTESNSFSNLLILLTFQEGSRSWSTQSL